MGEMTRAMTREPVAGQKGKMLSVKEIGDILSEPLRECGPTAAYLGGGGYVRADRYSDIRSDDELTATIDYLV